MGAVDSTLPLPFFGHASGCWSGSTYWYSPAKPFSALLYGPKVGQAFLPLRGQSRRLVANWRLRYTNPENSLIFDSRGELFFRRGLFIAGNDPRRGKRSS